MAASCAALLAAGLLWTTSLAERGGGKGRRRNSGEFAKGIHGPRRGMRGRKGPHMESGAMFEHLAKRHPELNITDAQLLAIKTIRESRKENMKAAYERVMEARRALHTATNAENPDPEAIQKASDKLAKASADAALLHADLRNQVNAVLTPEQVEQLKALREQHEGRSGKRHGKHGKWPKKPDKTEE